jgi:SAM-dependent methyltransferase
MTEPTPFDYDAELTRYHQRLLRAMDVGPDDRILDIGCGAGLTTRDAAARAVRGSALGVDISDRMIATARRLSEGVPNVRFERADVQTASLPTGEFSLAISRFGTMFFGDPKVAFGNIACALRPGARFVQLVWQEAQHQEWATVIKAAGLGSEGGGAFSLADPEVARELMTGFTEIEFEDVREPVYYGPTAEAARDAIRGFRMGDDSRGSDERLLALVRERERPDGVWFDARAWIMTARRTL